MTVVNVGFTLSTYRVMDDGKLSTKDNTRVGRNFAQLGTRRFGNVVTERVLRVGRTIFRDHHFNGVKG